MASFVFAPFFNYIFDKGVANVINLIAIVQVGQGKIFPHSILHTHFIYDACFVVTNSFPNHWGYSLRNFSSNIFSKSPLSRLVRGVSMGAMHTALVRLEEKGYIKSVDGETTEERLGRPRKYFQITALGKKAIAYAKSTRDELWNAIPRIVLETIRPKKVEPVKALLLE